MKWQVVALSGQDIHLLGPDGGGEVVLAGHLFADPGFTVVGADAPQAAPQWGLFETAPAAAREKALAWQRHVREVECGLTGGPGSEGVVREQYDPQRHTLAEREHAKAAELTALGFGRVSRTTVQRMRLAYRKQGLWGLLDHRTTRASNPTGRADERVVAAVREALRRRRGRSRGTINGLFPLIHQILEDRHGPGTVPAPSQATLYRLVTNLARPGELPTGPVRQVPASVDGRAFTPATALRPGEQVQVDTTRLDVLALFDNGRLARPELTIAVDVATAPSSPPCCAQARPKPSTRPCCSRRWPSPTPPAPPGPTSCAWTTPPHSPTSGWPHSTSAWPARRPGPSPSLPETIVVDRGKVFVSAAFTAACEHLGISVQPAPPHAPTAKGIVERTFGTINHLFCQHLPGYTGSDVTRRGPDTEKDACYSVPQLQDLLDEWLVHYHHRPHEGLRHPLMPRKALTPNQMWAALVAVAGHVPVPLTGHDYLELLPVRWQAITPAGITIHHRTYDHDLLAPYRGQASPVAGRGGKWEIHYNPHDIRQIWVRLLDGELTEIPWIHRDHVHQPFNDHTWQHIRTHAQHSNHDDPQQHEADLADALDQLMRRVTSGHATTAEQALLARATTTPVPAARPPHPGTAPATGEPAHHGEDGSIDDLDDLPDDGTRPAAATGFGLYDAYEEAEKW
ncbi:Mu transposase C-terminal domain-containing protein [Streptomyces sp. enrichment culture]|uniref:Mu transposase C-terminal domain-containing protein n=1 Tax=Streptomyces sp. enrichment culture TaxID=1795815 RepID=UPI003F561B54